MDFIRHKAIDWQMVDLTISNLSQDIEEKDTLILFLIWYISIYFETQILTQKVSGKHFISLKITMDNKDKIRQAFNMTGDVLTISELFE